MQLILEENGQTRRFKLKPGTLTIGSSDSCTLTVASDDVADVHLELRVTDDLIEVTPRKGVASVKLGGVPIQATSKFTSGKKLQFGSAVLRIEGTTSAASVARPDATPTKAGPGPKRSASTSTRPAVKRRSRRSQSKSIPTWAVFLLAIPLLALAYKTFVSFGEGTSERGFSAQASFKRIEDSMQVGDFKLAQSEFAKVDAQQGLDAEWVTAFETLRTRFKQQGETTARITDNSRGTAYLESQLRSYIKKYLRNNGRAEARVFVARAEEFLKTWPQHPEADWVRRNKDQFAIAGKMDEEANLADITWEAKTLTWAFPANYKRAFEILEAFEARADDREAVVARGLIRTHKEGEKAYFAERLDLAAGLYEDGAKSKALGYCVELVKGVDDQALANDAARRITKMAGVERALRGIQRDRPLDFAVLARNPVLNPFFKKIGLL